MRALVTALVAAAIFPGTAAAFSKTDLVIPMSDGAGIAATYYVPDGAPPVTGWPAVIMFHGLGETRTDTSNAVGMSINAIAETQLAPQGYAVLTFDARGHGDSGGLVGIDGPREIQDVHELFGWLANQGVNVQRIGAYGYSYGGGAIWRATTEGVPFAAIEVAASWTDLYAALAPQNLARSGIILGFWQSIQARADPSVKPVLDDVLAGRNLGGVRAYAAQRSTRGRFGKIKVPTFLMQGRRDFAFDLGQAFVPYARIKAPKRLYIADFGHAPSPQPAAELTHVLPESRAWFDRFLKGLPNGIDKRRPVEVAPDPWTGKTFSYKKLPARRTLRVAFPGRETIGATDKVARTKRKSRTRLETFGAPVVKVSLASTTGWSHVVAVLSALAPGGKEIVVCSGGVPTKLGRKPRRVTIRLLSQATLLPARSRLRLTIAATSTAQNPGNLVYLTGVDRSAKLTVGPAALTLPVLRKPVSR